ncbi:diaminopimelate decarboxylase family protein [Nocardia thailandica]|uniref:Diaminopimelate decarboxylase family protein n=1 Tax=Nocardia thailandica TaxID=257275 RepID=A0ABW6PRN0_9NOCA
MTLLEILPSLRSTTTPRLDPAVWPAETHYDGEGRICVGGLALAEVADEYGTPVRVLAEAEVRRQCRALRRALPSAEIVYGGSVLPSGAVARWAGEEGLGVGVCSAGELAVARAAGTDPARIVWYGAGKTGDDLAAAVSAGVGRIVLDCLSDVTRLGASATDRRQVLVRMRAGIDVGGHAVEREPGFGLGGAAAREAMARLVAHPRLWPVGLHCRLGHGISDPDHYGEAVRRLIGEMAWMRAEFGVVLTHLDLGGGFAAAARSGDAEMNLRELAEILEDALDAGCARHRFPRPVLTLAPGRLLVQRAGVTVYRVLGVERDGDGPAVVTVDGDVAGLGPHEVVAAGRHAVGARMTAAVLGGRRGAGQTLAAAVRLPADLAVGEVLAVPGTGVASAGVGAAPLVAVERGRSRVLLRREVAADLLARQVCDR